MTDRVQLWSCGGGRQSAGIAALIVQGRLPKPDHAAMVDTNREKGTTFKYVNAHVRPALEALGIPFTVIDRSKYATKDLWGGEDGKSILLPVYSDQSGELSKLPEFCSGEWKREVVRRWAKEQPGWFARGVDCWLGISWDEKRRMGARPRQQWFQPKYVLCERRWGLSVCLDAVHRQGWADPPISSCWMCPNMEDAEFASLPPDEFEMACRVDESIRQVDPHAFLHKSLIPLRQVKLNPKEPGGLFSGGCTSGMCY